MARTARQPASSVRSSRGTSSSSSARVSRQNQLGSRRSSAKTVRGRGASATRTVRTTPATLAAKRVNTASSQQRRSSSSSGNSGTRTVSAQRKPRSSSPLVHQVQLLFGTLAVLGISLCIAWFFIIPSVVLGSIQNKIILYTSDNLDGSNNSILLAYFGEKKEDHELFVFDSTEQAEVPNGYGSYAVGVVPSLLLLDAEHTDESVRSIMSRVFGVPIDEVVASESLATVRSPYETARTFWREPQQLLAALRVSYLAGQSDIATVHSYHETAALLGGGALVLTSEEKRCSVAVINTTTTRRLAENTSKLLERNNVYVVREDSSTPEEPVTHIQEATRPREECQTLVKKITPFFPVTTQVETQNSETQRFRADIVILLGTDTITAHGAEEQE